MPVRGLMSLLSPPVMRNLADLQEIGLLPYRPSPFAGLLSGLVQALQPLAAVREARRQEEEEQRQRRLAELLTTMQQYPPGQIPPELWEEYQRVARLPTGVQPPPEDPEAALRRRLLGVQVAREELGLQREREFLPFERKDWELTLQEKGQRVRLREISIEQAAADLREFLETAPIRRRILEATANLKELESRDAQAALEMGERPLREVLGIPDEQVPPHLRSFLDMPLRAVRLLRSDAGELLTWMLDPLEQPASTVLPAEVVESWKKRGVDLTKIPIRDLKTIAPDLLRAPRTVREVMGERWTELTRQYPYLEALADSPATPELILSLHDVFVKDEATKQQIARQLIDDYDRRINEGAAKGAPPALMGMWIGSRNALARELKLPEIDSQTAERLIASATVVWQLNVQKQALDVAKVGVQIQQARTAMVVSAGRFQLDKARTQAYLENVASQRAVRQTEAAVDIAKTIVQLTQRDLDSIKQRGGALSINTPMGPAAVRWNTFLRRWEVQTPQGIWMEAEQAKTEELVRQHLLRQNQALLMPPPPPSPAQRLRSPQRQQRSQTTSQRPPQQQRRPQLIRQ